jgi:hypothetical protein
LLLSLTLLYWEVEARVWVPAGNNSIFLAYYFANAQTQGHVDG